MLFAAICQLLFIKKINIKNEIFSFYKNSHFEMCCQNYNHKRLDNKVYPYKIAIKYLLRFIKVLILLPFIFSSNRLGSNSIKFCDLIISFNKKMLNK